MGEIILGEIFISMRIWWLEATVLWLHCLQWTNCSNEVMPYICW